MGRREGATECPSSIGHGARAAPRSVSAGRRGAERGRTIPLAGPAGPAGGQGSAAEGEAACPTVN